MESTEQIIHGAKASIESLSVALAFAQQLLKMPHNYWAHLNLRYEDLMKELPEERTPELKRAAFLLTEICNFNCVYCTSEDKEHGKTIPFETAIELVDATFGLGAKYAAITGGEVTTLGTDYVLTLIDYMQKKGLEVVVSTNGYFNEDMRNELADRKVALYISLDSMDPEENDKMVRREGAWNRVADNVKWLSEKTDVFICTMVINANYRTLPERLNQFAHEFPEVHDIQLMPPRNVPSYFLNLEQIKEFYEIVDGVEDQIREKYPLVNLKLERLFGDDKESMIRASQGRYSFTNKVPCYLLLEEIIFTPPDGVYSCGCMYRENQEPLTQTHDFLENPAETFKRMQRRILNTVPLEKRCDSACSPEVSAFNLLVDQNLKKQIKTDARSRPISCVY